MSLTAALGALSNYFWVGGDKRDRTADPLRAKQVLYQLSYIPKTEQALYHNKDSLTISIHRIIFFACVTGCDNFQTLLSCNFDVFYIVFYN